MHLKESKGNILAVTDEEILEAYQLIASMKVSLQNLAHVLQLRV